MLAHALRVRWAYISNFGTYPCATGKCAEIKENNKGLEIIQNLRFSYVM
jgi:hypothetical protein